MKNFCKLFIIIFLFGFMGFPVCAETESSASNFTKANLAGTLPDNASSTENISFMAMFASFLKNNGHYIKKYITLFLISIFFLPFYLFTYDLTKKEIFIFFIFTCVVSYFLWGYIEECRAP